MCVEGKSSEENYMLAIVPRAEPCLGPCFGRSPKIPDAWFVNAALWPAVLVDKDESRTDWLLSKDTNKWMVKNPFTCQFGAFKEKADRNQVSLGMGG